MPPPREFIELATIARAFQRSRALASIGVFHELDDRRFELNQIFTS